MKKLILATILVLFTSCNKEDYHPPSDPKEAILGKWELIEKGYEGHTKPTSENRYIEYLPDSVFGWYDYDTEEYIVSNVKYWIDTLLHEQVIREDGRPITIEYTYHFYEDKMRLEFVDVFAIFDTFIYQRKK